MKKIYSIAVAVIFLVNGFTTVAQVNLSNQGTFYVAGANDTVYINGDFENTSSAALTNNGRFYIKQNITNDQSSMAVGTGTLYLNGGSAQSVGGGQPFKTYNMVTNNSAGITLNANLSVSGAHTFTSGLITTSATPNYLIYESGSSYSGNNDSRHVNGWVKKIGNSDFTFPVGDATYERTASVTSLSASSEINCRYYTSTTNTNNLTNPIVKVKANEYWQIDKVSGGTAQIGLNWDHSKVIMDNVQLTNIVVAHYTGGSWTDAGGTASGNVTTTGSITSNSISSFSPFTLGYKSFPIPLKLLSFTAERRSGTSYLKWTTENEENVSHFDVQRSYEGILYSTIGNVTARNTSGTQYYSFNDNSALQGIAYYRIRSVDMDGKFTYSKIAVVSEYDMQSSGFVVLNPVHTNITILNKTGKEGSYNYQVFNSGAQLICRGFVTMGINGGAILPLPASVAAGQYILELSSGTFRFSQKILVQ